MGHFASYYKSKKSYVPFVPTDIAGCQLWLDAGQGITLNGSNVSQWADMSGNNNHAIQNTASAQPLWVDGLLNGNPVIRFDGLNDYMQFTDISTIRTVFVVIKHATGTQSNPAPILGHSSLYDFHAGYNDNLFYPQIVPKLSNGSIYVNGLLTDISTLKKRNTYSLLSIVASGNVSAQYITNDRNIANRCWYGDYSEIIIYNSSLSDTDRQQVENYLNTKYAIW